MYELRPLLPKVKINLPKNMYTIKTCGFENEAGCLFDDDLDKLLKKVLF